MIILHTNIIHGSFTLSRECFVGIQSWNVYINFLQGFILRPFTVFHYFSHNCFFSLRNINYFIIFLRIFKTLSNPNIDLTQTYTCTLWLLHQHILILIYCLNYIVSLNQLEKILKMETKRTIYFLKLNS